MIIFGYLMYDVKNKDRYIFVAILENEQMIRGRHLISLMAFTLLMSISNNMWPLHSAMSENRVNYNSDNNQIQKLRIIQSNIQTGEKLINEGYFFMAIDLLNENIALVQNRKELQLQLAQTHFQLSMAYNGLVNVEKFKYHLDEYSYYMNIVEPDNPINKAFYYSFLSKYYNMRMLTDTAYMYSELSMNIFHKNKSILDDIPSHIFYENHLFSLRNANVSYEYKMRYRDSIKSMVDEYYPKFHVKKSTAHMYSEMFVLDSIANALKVGELSSDQTKMVTRLRNLFEKESENIQNHIGKYNPYSARINLIIGLLYSFTNDYEKSISYYGNAINITTANDVLDNQIFTPNNFVLTSAYFYTYYTYEKIHGLNSDINYLLKNERMLDYLKVAWQFYIEDRISSFHDFNTNEYIKNPFATIQKNYFNIYKKTNDEDYKQKIFESGELAKQYSVQYLMSIKNKNELQEKNKPKYVSYEAIIQGLNTHNSPKEKFMNQFAALEVPVVYNIDELQITDIQEKLKPNQAIISYNDYNGLQESLIMAHVITTTTDTIIYLNNHDFKPLTEGENLMNKAIYSYDVSLFQEQSLKYYKNLLEPIINNFNAEIQELIIIKSPSIEKQNINFNALVSKKINSSSFRNLCYMANKFVISTPITVSSYFNNNQNEHSLAEVPITIFLANNDSLAPLNHSTEFINRVSGKFNIRAFTGDECNKKNLLNSLKNNEVLIVISHGQGSNSYVTENNGIFLSDGFLTSKDIYSIESNCKLVVLAGCKTGVGFNSNEGQINLARAFVYSGVKNIILSSDEIDEISTLQILEKWLDNLADGNSISHAFNLAQKEFIFKSSSRKSNPICRLPLFRTVLK